MMVAIVIVLALAAANLFFLYRRSLRESIAVNEYLQFLLLNPEVFADHRGKFEAYLLTTGDKTSDARSADAMKTVISMARKVPSILLANVGSRNAVAQRGRG
jgi:hypothetical protein